MVYTSFGEKYRFLIAGGKDRRIIQNKKYRHK
jgi:hypothetical protein